MPAKQTLPVFFFCLIASFVTLAQATNDPRTYKLVAKHDLSFLWREDSIRPENGDERVPVPEPLGYIGRQYQRFYIHYNTVVKSKKDPYLYYVSGKTRVKENICRFSGTFRITAVRTWSKSTNEPFVQGNIVTRVYLQEDSTQKGSGVFHGELITDFYIDSSGQLQYDALDYVADGYCNNQCVTTWISNTTRKSQKCVWGDYRMPDSKELDQGVGDVSINAKYLPFGWESFVDAYHGNLEAEKQEAAKWWK